MNIQKNVNEYVNQHASIKDCFVKNIINYSSLSREIIAELKLDRKNFEAVLIACRRYHEKLKHKSSEDEIVRLLRKSKIHIRTKVCRFIIESRTHLSDNIIPLHFIQGDDIITIIAREEDYSEMAHKYMHTILDKKKELAELIIISQKNADIIPGFSSFVAGLLASAGINIFTTLGSYTEDIFIIDNKDISKALDVLNKLSKTF